MSDLRSFLVDEEDEGTRLDVFLQGYCDDLSRSRIQGLIADDAVRVSDTRRKASFRVRLGDRVEMEVDGCERLHFSVRSYGPPKTVAWRPPGVTD